MKKISSLISLFAMLFFVLSFANIYSQSAQYKVSGKIIIGGEARFDYLSVDESTNRLFVSHATKVHVIDLSTDKVIAEIADQTGVHGMAFVPEFNKGYISNRDGQVTVFDLKNMKKTGTIKIEGKNPNPDAIIYDAFSKKVYTMNHTGNSVSAIDPKNDTVIGTVAIDGVAEAAVSDEKGNIYINLEDKNAINVIDTKTFKVTAKWSIAPTDGPTGMAIDLKTNRLFTVGEKKMAVLDITTGKVVTTVPIGGGCDGCVFDPASKLCISSNGEGTMTFVKEESPNKFSVISTVATAKGARTIAIDNKSKRIFTLAALDDSSKPGTKSFGVLILDNKK